MPSVTLNIFASYIAQAAEAVVITILLLSFYRHYGKRYLYHWTLSWWALSLFYVCGALSLYFSVVQKASPGIRFALSSAGGIAGYLQLGWLLYGCYELATRRPVKLRQLRWQLPALGVFGLAITLFLALTIESIEGRFFLRVGVRSFFAGVAFLIAAVMVWRMRGPSKSLGFLLVSVSFGLYAMEQFHYFGLALTQFARGTVYTYPSYLGFLDFVLQGLMGLGMIASLLEDEREAAVLAAGEIEHLAYHDSLTGLPNRPLFLDRMIVALAHAQRYKHGIAVFFLDLDRFKDINDSLGHSIGDELLRAVGDRVRKCVREGDTVARFGGDEFTVMAEMIDRVEDAAKIAQKIQESVKLPFVFGEHELFVSFSIGISLYPADGTDPETLVKNADTAMYRAKEQGRDNYQLYAPAMNARALERLALENMLRKALVQKELIIKYQPLIDLQTGQISSVEALLRWNHPELGLLAPAHFISAAEVSGLIVPIGNWVLKTACAQIMEWQTTMNRTFGVAVNLSARQFQQPELLATVVEALKESGLPPHLLELEITETNAMLNAESTIHTLLELKNIGVRISMDDFGTGYSSLSYLKRFPIDTLKLDQSFVRDVVDNDQDAAIVTAVITMAHCLKLEVVAEGVETRRQLEFFRERKCDKTQGYLFSVPLTIDEFEKLVAEGTGHWTKL